MSSSRIEELKRQRQAKVTKRGSQSPYAIVVTVVVSTIYLVLIKHNIYLSTFWIIGILIGITLQRSRFCFAASFRDPIMVGNSSLFKTIILSFIISTIAFFMIQYRTAVINPDYLLTDIPGQLKPVGLHTALGAILFGGGMVVAGGCASGTLVRIGEGYIMQVVVLVGFIIGTVMGAMHFPFWDSILISKAPTIYIPKYLGFFPALIFQLILLGILYLVAHWYDKKNNIMTMQEE
ncbi:YeeE/YedE family protein [Alkalicella caledoniensis]|uniref:YeeE/YedE family protein n=1 Tax=Alkalicella caledoniensis TaxID=2731377 RepID=A0A7G9W9K4_ALKCA|nr:YeeE/YedE thiosulfate transporter family protein [Alkalicella caledoniensis]QNO15366.1 YeeE/YedE family protein [Alkalicella caledoniensis]